MYFSLPHYNLKAVHYSLPVYMSTSPTLSHLKVGKCVIVNYVNNCERSKILPYFQVNNLA